MEDFHYLAALDPHRWALRMCLTSKAHRWRQLL